MSKIREIDTKTIISNKTSSHFIEKYSIDKWIDILVNLYVYYILSFCFSFCLIKIKQIYIYVYIKVYSHVPFKIL
jgi:hypothetical protein